MLPKTYETFVNNRENVSLTSQNSKCEIIIADTLEKIETIRPLWEILQQRQSAATAHPNSEIDRYLSILGDTAEPYVILLQRDGRPEAMLIGQKQTMIFRCKIGCLNLFKLPLNGLSIVYRGFLGQETDEVCHTFIGELIHMLHNGQCDVVELEYLAIDSQMYRLARTIPNILSRGYFPKVDSHWRMAVPRHIDLFYRRLSKKHSYNLKRSMRILEDRHRVRVATYRSEDDLDEAIAMAVKISPKTYQYGLGWGIVDDDNMRRRLTVMARRNWLRLHILFIDDKPCAFQMGLQYQRTYFAERRGFDANWKNWNIGTTLFLKVLEELCQESEVDFVDFNPGNADYKPLFGNKRWPESTIYIISPRLYPICVNILNSLTRGLNSGLVWLARKIGLERQIKSRLSNLLRLNKYAPLLWFLSSFFSAGSAQLPFFILLSDF
jgi:hypothetical protein